MRLVLPLGAAGVGDITARIIAERLGDKLGQRFVIENMPGPGGIVAGRAVLSAPADGYTLLLMTGGIASSVPLYNKFPLDMTKDFVAISSMGYFDCLMVVNAQSEFKTLGDFLKVAREKPGKLNIGTISAGGVQNLTANYFKQASGADCRHRAVPHHAGRDRGAHAQRRGDGDRLLRGAEIGPRGQQAARRGLDRAAALARAAQRADRARRRA